MAYKPTDTTIIDGSTNSPDGNAVYDYVGTGGPFLPLSGGTLTGSLTVNGNLIATGIKGNVSETLATNEKIHFGSKTTQGDNSVITIAMDRSLSANGHAFSEFTTFTPTVANLGFASYDSGAITGGTFAIDHIIGYQSRQEHRGSGVLDRMYGFGSFPLVAGPTGDVFGFYVADIAKSGTPTIDTQYGLYIASLSTATTNYGIYGAGSNDWRNNGAVISQEAYIGRGYNGNSSYAQFSHSYFRNSTTAFGFMQNLSGDTFIRSASGRALTISSHATDILTVTDTALTATVPVVAPSLTITEALETSAISTSTATLAPLAGKTYKTTSTYLGTCTITLTITGAMTVGNECYMYFGGSSASCNVTINYPDLNGVTQTIITVCGDKRSLIIRRAASGFLVVG